MATGPSRFVTKFRKGRNCDRDGAPHSSVGEAFGGSRGEAGERHHGGAGGDQLGVVCAADERREGRRRVVLDVEMRVLDGPLARRKYIFKFPRSFRVTRPLLL